MRQIIQLDAAAVSDRGLKRSTNEDSVLCDPLLGLFAVADGMGGHASGEVASRLAIDTVHREWRERRQLHLIPGVDHRDPGHLLGDVVAAANQLVLHRSRSCDLFAGMGTTLLVAVLHEMTLHYAHVGDSRLYRLRSGRLERLTRDHSFAEDLLARGYSTAEALRRAESKALTRALGPSLEVAIDLASFEVHEGDVLLLCSDGLTGLLDDDEIATQLEAGRLAGRSLDSQVETLIALANERGGHDNITVVLALC